ncbi:MAG: HK97 family phage prohead protease [Acidobacteria bacterium]|nr:HK97 family phage prohead protease [Acidobacteriota bacterium]
MAMKRTDALERKSFKFSMDAFDEETGIFKGYASVFGGTDDYGDTIFPGAFKKTLKEHKFFPVTWTHNIMDPLGIIYLEEDAKGLRVVKGDLCMDVQSAREKRSLAKQGAITGLSIGFRAIKYDMKKEGTGRNLRELAVGEVALCLFPADDAARISEVKTAGFESNEEFLEATGPWLEQKPFPNEHSCVLTDAGKYDKFRRGSRDHEGKKYAVIYGHVKGGDSWEDHSFRYDKETWTSAEAKAHCTAHKGTFEAAEKCDDCNFDDTDPGKTNPPETKPEDKARESLTLKLRGLNDELKRFVESH